MKKSFISAPVLAIFITGASQSAFAINNNLKPAQPGVIKTLPGAIQRSLQPTASHPQNNVAVRNYRKQPSTGKQPATSTTQSTSLTTSKPQSPPSAAQPGSHSVTPAATLAATPQAEVRDHRGEKSAPVRGSITPPEAIETPPVVLPAQTTEMKKATIKSSKENIEYLTNENKKITQQAHNAIEAYKKTGQFPPGTEKKTLGCNATGCSAELSFWTRGNRTVLRVRTTADGRIVPGQEKEIERALISDYVAQINQNNRNIATDNAWIKAEVDSLSAIPAGISNSKETKNQRRN